MWMSADFLCNLPDTWSLTDGVLTFDAVDGPAVYVIVGYDEANDVYEAVPSLPRLGSQITTALSQPQR
jgi:hypothetical protein